MKFVSDFKSAYYLRLFVEDEVGVLAKITGIFAKCGVSIIEIAQKPKATFGSDNDRVPLVIITHRTKENSVKNAVAKINASGLASVESLIRVEAETN